MVVNFAITLAFCFLITILAMLGYLAICCSRKK